MTDAPTPSRAEILQGTLEMLTLKALTLQPMHGWGISIRLRQISGDVFDVNQGSLYPALQRLEHRGDIESEWRSTENNRRARYYTLTPQGGRALGEEVDKWKRFAAAMALVLERGS
jgi:transcriptional regulator